MLIILLSAPVDGAYGVDDLFAGETVGARHFSVAGGTATAALTFVGEVWAGGGVDCAADAAAGEEGLVCGVDDGAVGEMELGDVCADQGDFGVEGGGGGEGGVGGEKELVGGVEVGEGGDVGLVDYGGHCRGWRRGVLEELQPAHGGVRVILRGR